MMKTSLAVFKKVVVRGLSIFLVCQLKTMLEYSNLARLSLPKFQSGNVKGMIQDKYHICHNIDKKKLLLIKPTTSGNNVCSLEPIDLLNLRVCSSSSL